MLCYECEMYCHDESREDCPFCGTYYEESGDYWNDVADAVEADADALRSCGWGTDEDYGCYDSGLEDW